MFYGIGLVSLAAVLIFGVGAKGAQRWLDIGFTRLQPAEFMKVCVPLMISAYLGKRFVPPTAKHVFWSAFMVILPTLLIIQQPDLGTGILVFVSRFLVLFLPLTVTVFFSSLPLTTFVFFFLYLSSWAFLCSGVSLA